MKQTLLPLKFAALAAAVLGFVIGCNERVRDPQVIVWTPPTDAGAVDLGSDVGEPLGPPCTGTDGSSCELPRAFGVCVGGVCSRVACLTGSIDCDGDPFNGCESRVRLDTACGACGVACGEAERCQLGPNGYLCSAEPVCRLGTFDLDLDLDNECEWTSEWSNGFSLDPAGVRPELLEQLSSGQVWFAGRLDSERWVGTLDGTAFPLDAPLEAPEPPLTIAADGDVFVAWPDGISRLDPRNGETHFVDLACTTERRVVDVSLNPVTAIVGFDTGVMAWPQREVCDDCAVRGRSFEQEDYLAAFWPGAPDGVATGALSGSEVAQCTPCSVDPATGQQVGDPDCAPDACRVGGLPGTCGDCDPSGCPRFEPVELLTNSQNGRVYVLTRRGLVGLQFANGWTALFRVEEPFDPDEASGRAFIDAELVIDGDDDVIIMLDNAGRLLTLRIPRSGQGLPVPTSEVVVGFGAKLDATHLGRLLLGDPLLLVGSSGPSAGIVRLGVEDGPGINGLAHVGSTRVDDGFLVLYEAVGLFFERRLTPRN